MRAGRRARSPSSVSARSRCTSVSPRRERLCRPASEKSWPRPASAPAAVARAAASPRRRPRPESRRARAAIAGAISSASVNLPEPYFACASASPATVPGTPIASAGVARLAADRPRPCRRGRCRASSRPARSRDSRSRCRVAAGEMHQHVAAAADIAGARIGHRQREAGRDRGVDRVAALLAGLRRRCARRAPPAPPPCRCARRPVDARGVPSGSVGACAASGASAASTSATASVQRTRGECIKRPCDAARIRVRRGHCHRSIARGCLATRGECPRGAMSVRGLARRRTV